MEKKSKQPYSSYTRAGNFIHISGQVPRNAQREILGADIVSQAEVVMEKFLKVVQEAGAEPAQLLKVNVYLADMQSFDAFNAVYLHFMQDARPARTTIGCVLNGVLVEVDGVAYIDEETDAL